MPFFCPTLCRKSFFRRDVGFLHAGHDGHGRGYRTPGRTHGQGHEPTGNVFQHRYGRRPSSGRSGHGIIECKGRFLGRRLNRRWSQPGFCFVLPRQANEIGLMFQEFGKPGFHSFLLLHKFEIVNKLTYLHSQIHAVPALQTGIGVFFS